MRTIKNGRWVFVFVSALTAIIALGQDEIQGASHSTKSRPSTGTAKSSLAASRTNSACNQCDGDRALKNQKRPPSKRAMSAGKTACHPKGYVDPRIAKKYNAAIREMKREGIKPEITSAWRSSATQARLHKCSRSTRCRKAHPGLYYALPSGQSLHEAGFAVDISGVAAGPRGNKRLTSRGRRIVGIMRKNGFDWRYGLADPAHFEADPRKNGYRSVKAAITKNQTQCTVNLVAGKQKKSSAKTDARATAKPASNKRASIQTLPTRSRSQRG